MSTTLLQPGTSAPKPGASAPKDPLAGMTLLTAEGQSPRAKAAIEITKSALKRIRVAMAKEGVSPDQGGLRVGIQGGGCSGLSYNIRFDTEPRLKDRTFVFGEGVETPNDPSGAKPIRLFVDPKSFLYLAGMVLDFEETLMRQGFNFINPNSTKSCGLRVKLFRLISSKIQFAHPRPKPWDLRRTRADECACIAATIAASRCATW